MNLGLIRLAGAALAALALGGAAQAQHVIVRSLDEAQAAPMRAAIEASMRAAERGNRVGMVTGTANPNPVNLKGGGVAQELDASTLMFSVARINSDGKVELVCVDSLDAAQQTLLAPAFAKRLQLSTREVSHVSK